MLMKKVIKKGGIMMTYRVQNKAIIGVIDDVLKYLKTLNIASFCVSVTYLNKNEIEVIINSEPSHTTIVF